MGYSEKSIRNGYILAGIVAAAIGIIPLFLSWVHVHSLIGIEDYNAIQLTSTVISEMLF
ncbi:MAG: hypothetical protein LBM39_01690 [Candidatus Methanoplasma sp.]|jgi:hypothetical protein|nr:hypothetical protein [Candidatus Methanoplasma sp.]